MADLRPLHAGRARSRGAFTLLEVLVVIGLIALLVGITLPAISRAKEQSRQAVCLSNLKQQGNGFAAYAGDHRGEFPWAGGFRYSLMEGEYYPMGNGSAAWTRVNAGCLYPKYIGSAISLFYCPSNRDADGDGPRGAQAFLSRYHAPDPAMPGYVDSHDFGNAPIGGYAYALPALPGQSPRDAGPKTYSEETMVSKERTSSKTYTSPFYEYTRDTTELTDQQASSFLGHFPMERRGRHTTHALLTDAYFGGYQGYHLNGFNVLYNDMHARRVADPRGVIMGAIRAGEMRSGRNYAPRQLWELGKPFMTWDYFSSNP